MSVILQINNLFWYTEHDSNLAIEWFKSSYMKPNQDKCYLLMTVYEYENIWAWIGEVNIWESLKQELLGAITDRDLIFNEYVSSLCKKAGGQLIAWILNLMSFQQRKMLMKSFVEDQFGYYPLVFVFHGRELNRRINHIHERSLCIVYKDHNSSFRRISLSVFTTETFSFGPLNYSKLRKIFPMPL